jgi:hypothetical protein
MMAKALYKTKQYTRCFELIQMQYSKTPEYPSLMFLYGKYIVKATALQLKTSKLSIDSGFLGSGIGALEECTRSCVLERQPQVHYIIGLAYKVLKMPLKTYQNWLQASELGLSF